MSQAPHHHEGAPAPRRITVVTAVHAPSARFLPEAHRSLAAQELPDGWEWRWVIREDGTTDAVRPHVPDDERIVFRQGRPGGPGVARTLALADADGEYVKILDADDQLTPGALARDLAALEARPDLGWATSRALDLLPDGSTAGFPGDPDEGPLERGAVLAHFTAHDHRAQVHPATLFVRRELLLALGGWMALPASEDTGLLLALDAVSRGWFTAETGLLYRKWDGQVTGQAPHVDPAERRARMAVVVARAHALAGLRAGRASPR
ncbi:MULTISPECIES: glycosyltransferase family 2 protein [Streptomyces]|uniref:Glycosyltransferase n=2 Tax=Streptomyces TaxID=1883 RepID=A0A2U9P4Z6_STRAS|nr:glycosyltransferase family 2 protein [Streptomyces actuosus]AWT44573.1 glycosyltransferase [Streptomyces actuosus]MBM4820224.1 glycosyltransferase family 2 protein [Streptomyces actuosus]